MLHDRLLVALKLYLLAALVGGLVAVGGPGPQPALADFHFAQIGEVMSGFGGDPDVQFVEIFFLSLYGDSVANTRLTVFNADGSFNTVLLEPLGSNAGAPGRFLMATQAFVDLTPSPGVTPDYIFTPGIPPDAGMVCWGAPGVVAPVDLGSWDAADPNQYVDCVSYGGAAFTGSNPMMSNPESASPGAGDGKLSLTRILVSAGNETNPWRISENGMFYDLLDPSPENDVGVIGNLVQPTPTPTSTPTPTATPTFNLRPLPVGGVAELPDVAGTPLAAEGSSGPSASLVAGVVAAVAVALGGASWYARRRLR